MTSDDAQTACGRLDWKWQNRTVGGVETEEGTAHEPGCFSRGFHDSLYAFW